MKLHKIFTFALAALAMTACSDDKTTNGSDVNVEFKESTISVLESSIQLNVPIVVNGDNNGDITVQVEITELQPSPAIIDHNFKLTSDRLNIPAGVKSVDLEFLLRDDYQRNEDRRFEITITQVDNANIGTRNTCIVTLVDNDNTPYFGLQGAWKVQYIDNNGNIATQDVVIEGVPEGQLGFERRLFLTYQTDLALSAGSGWNRTERIRLDYDAANNCVHMELGQTTCDYSINPPFTLSFSDGTSTPPIDQMADKLLLEVMLTGDEKPGNLSSGSLDLNWDDSFQTLAVDEEDIKEGLGDFDYWSVNVWLATNSGTIITTDAEWRSFKLIR